MSENDKQLIAELQALLDTLARTRRGLIHEPRKGCVCDGPALCALHASVYRHLETAADELARAIHDAGRE